MLARLLQYSLASAFMLSASVIQAQSAVVLAGQWHYMAEQSDDIRERIVDNLIYSDYSNARWLETSNGRRLIGVREIRPRPESIDRLMELLDQAVPVKPLVRIERNGEDVALHYAGGRVRDLCIGCDGERSVVQSTAHEGPQKLVIAAWEEDTLTVETNTNAGLSVLEVYEHNKETGRLHVEFKIDASRFPEPIHARYVYGRERASTAK